MLKTPLKNSKNVNKPFRSPFEKIDNEKIKKHNEGTPKNILHSPQNISRSFEAKRVLSLDAKDKNLSLEQYNENAVKDTSSACSAKEPKLKKRKLNDSNYSNNVDIENHLVKSNQQSKPDVPSKVALHLLKRRVFEKRQELDVLNSRTVLVKKHNPEVLKNSIKRWKAACQNALEELCQEYNNRNGENSNLKISDILSILKIPKELVGYSEEEDSFE